MKRLSPVLLCILLLSARLWSAQQPSPQQLPPAPQPQTSAATQTTPFAATIKKAVVLIRVAFMNGGTLSESDGTGFFVYYEDKRLGDNKGFVYLVTNRHVALPGIESGQRFQVTGTALRLNLRDKNQGFEDVDFPTGPQLHWFFPSDDAVDLAVFPMAPSEDRYDYVNISVSEFATKDVVEAQQVSEGDSVLFTGFFVQFPGIRRFEPIIREGVLAMMPDEKMPTTLSHPGNLYFGNLYLADLHVFHGNSGSPLMVNVAGLRNGSLTIGYSYRLLGAVSGFYSETSDFQLTIANTITGALQENSGIALVVPADELKSLLDSAPLQAQRDAEVARQQMRK